VKRVKTSVNIQFYKKVDLGSHLRIEISILQLGGFKVFLAANSEGVSREWSRCDKSVRWGFIIAYYI
jgi:hypothetical protein